MLTPSAAFKARAVQSHRRLVKFQHLDGNFAVLDEFTPYILDGSINITANLEGRRTMTCTVANPNGLYSPAQTSDPFWFNSTLRVLYGVVFADGTSEFLTSGTFLVNKAWTDTSRQDWKLTVTAVDFWKKFQVFSLTTVAKYAAGSSLNAAIVDLCTRAGVTNYVVDPSLATLLFHAAPSADLQLARGTSYADCFAILANDYSLDFWFDEVGTFHANKYIDPNLVASQFTMNKTDTAIFAMSGGIEDSHDIKNHIGVASTNVDIQPIFQEAKDNNTISPTYVGGQFGDRYFEYSADWIQTTQQALDTARSILKRKLFFAKRAVVDHVPMPWLDGFDVGTLTSSDLKLNNQLYYIDKSSLSLSSAVQKTDLLEVRPLP